MYFVGMIDIAPLVEFIPQLEEASLTGEVVINVPIEQINAELNSFEDTMRRIPTKLEFAVQKYGIAMGILVSKGYISFP